MKQLKATYEKWQKQQEKLKKKGEDYQTEMPRPTLAIRMQNTNEIDPEKRLQLQFETPISTPLYKGRLAVVSCQLPTAACRPTQCRRALCAARLAEIWHEL